MQNSALRAIRGNEYGNIKRQGFSARTLWQFDELVEFGQTCSVAELEGRATRTDCDVRYTRAGRQSTFLCHIAFTRIENQSRKKTILKIRKHISEYFEKHVKLI